MNFQYAKKIWKKKIIIFRCLSSHLASIQSCPISPNCGSEGDGSYFTPNRDWHPWWGHDSQKTAGTLWTDQKSYKPLNMIRQSFRRASRRKNRYFFSYDRYVLSNLTIYVLSLHLNTNNQLRMTRIVLFKNNISFTFYCRPSQIEHCLLNICQLYVAFKDRRMDFLKIICLIFKSDQTVKEYLIL